MDAFVDNQPHSQPDQNDHRVSIFSRYPERSLFIRDLPFSCTSHDLKRFAAEQTQLPIIRAMVCDNKQQKTLYFGYVLLGSEDQVPIAIERLVGKRFIGRDIKVQAFRSNVVLETANTGVIHVGFRGLKVDIPLITEEVLRSFLESYGDLDQIVIRNLLYTKEGNQCGYAFVSFKNMDTNHHVVDSVRQVKIQNIVYQFSWSRHHALQCPPTSSSHEAAVETSDGANNVNELDEYMEKLSVNPSSSSTECGSNSQSQKTGSSDESLHQKPKFHNPPHRDKFFHPNHSSNGGSSGYNHSSNKVYTKGRHSQYHPSNQSDTQMNPQDPSGSYMTNHVDNNTRNTLPQSLYPSNISTNLPPILTLPTPSPPYGYLISTNAHGQPIMNPQHLPYGSFPVTESTAAITTPTGVYYVSNHSVVNSDHSSPHNGQIGNSNSSSTSTPSSVANNSNNSSATPIAATSQMIPTTASSAIPSNHAGVPHHMTSAAQSNSTPSSPMFTTQLYPPTASIQYIIPNSTAASPASINSSYFLTPQFYPTHPHHHHHHHHHPHLSGIFPPRPASPFQLTPTHATTNNNPPTNMNNTNMSTNSLSSPPVLNVMPIVNTPTFTNYPVAYPTAIPQQQPSLNQPHSSPIVLQPHQHALPTPPPMMQSHIPIQTHSVSTTNNAYYTNPNNSGYFSGQIAPQVHHSPPQQQQQQQEQKF